MLGIVILMIVQNALLVVLVPSYVSFDLHYCGMGKSVVMWYGSSCCLLSFLSIMHSLALFYV